jgi:ABC-type nitrate/sulfonate/bicarbonate transport system substrate-binding protein
MGDQGLRSLCEIWTEYRSGHDLWIRSGDSSVGGGKHSLCADGRDSADHCDQPGSNVIATRRSFLEKNREVVKRFLQAYGEGIYQLTTNKEKALAITNQRLKQKNTALVEEAYQFYAPIFSFPPRVSHEGLRVVLEMLAQRSPGAKVEMSVDKYLDERALDELEREGLFK